jgi:hypothetical protein
MLPQLIQEQVFNLAKNQKIAPVNSSTELLESEKSMQVHKFQPSQLPKHMGYQQRTFFDPQSYQLSAVKAAAVQACQAANMNELYNKNA